MQQHQNETKTCQNCKTDFIIEIDDFAFYDKIKVPPPTFCPECRMMRRFVYRNERKLFKVKDYFSEKIIFSLYPEEANRKVVTQDEWFSDSWTADDYARDFDFSRDFFTQLFELDKDIPIYALNVKMMSNSDYCGNASALKNCYLLFNSSHTENSLYGSSVDNCRDCVDNTVLTNCERCYESFYLLNCYQCYFSIMCAESSNLWFSRDCLSCSNCFGCTNLRKSSYCIFNKQYSKEEYFKELQKMNLDTKSSLKESYDSARIFWETQPVKSHQGLKNVNSAGAYVSHSKNVNDSYLVFDSEDLKYCQYMMVGGNKDCMDSCIWGEKSILNYETSVCGENSYDLKFSLDCWPNVRSCEYSMHLKSCSDCFGCVGLRNKQYCIFNKQYTKEEYFEVVEKIKDHMNKNPYIDKKGNEYRYGEFFPIEFSPFGYNNTIAFEQFNLDKKDILLSNYPWIEVAMGEYKITREWKDVPEFINETNEDICNEILECMSCHNPFKIVFDEYLFLKKENLPLPNNCHECRHKNRIKDRLKPFLYNKSCSLCNCNIKTAYSENTIIYCESCYQKTFS